MPTAEGAVAATPEAAHFRDPTRRGPERPDRLLGYTAVMGTYGAAMVAGLLLSGRPGDDRAQMDLRGWSDVALVGLATFKLSRLVTKQTVTTPLRAPFARDDGPAGPGERNARPQGTGLRRSLGELLTCPFCLDVWLASAGTLALRRWPSTVQPLLRTFAAVAVADFAQFLHAERVRTTD